MTSGKQCVLAMWTDEGMGCARGKSTSNMQSACIHELAQAAVSPSLLRTALSCVCQSAKAHVVLFSPTRTLEGPSNALPESRVTYTLARSGAQVRCRAASEPAGPCPQEGTRPSPSCVRQTGVAASTRAVSVGGLRIMTWRVPAA